MNASIRELRSNTREILAAVRRGDTVILSNRGKPCAKIMPIEKKFSPKKSHAAFGMWKRRSDLKSVKKYVHDLRQPRHAR